MWPSVTTEESLTQLIQTWMITLTKHGCESMLQAGSDGTHQAMILSFGALKFSNDHLEFGTPPGDLHRDYFFRRINYGNNTHVNITVVVGEDNKAQMSVALDRNDKPYYACDAGCLDDPVKLSLVFLFNVSMLSICTMIYKPYFKNIYIHQIFYHYILLLYFILLSDIIYLLTFYNFNYALQMCK